MVRSSLGIWRGFSIDSAVRIAKDELIILSYLFYHKYKIFSRELGEVTSKEVTSYQLQEEVSTKRKYLHWKLGAPKI